MRLPRTLLPAVWLLSSWCVPAIALENQGAPPAVEEAAKSEPEPAGNDESGLWARFQRKYKKARSKSGAASEELIERVRIRHSQKRLHALTIAIKEAEDAGRADDVKKLVIEYQSLAAKRDS